MRAIGRTWAWACRLVMTPPAGWGIVGVSAVAFVLGIVYWYGRQLPRVSPIFWVFVPDCPLYALLFGIALGALLLGHPIGRKAPLLSAIVAFGLVKYGVWTVQAWAIFWSQTGLFTPESLIMTVAHLGMILEGAFLIGFLCINRRVAMMSGLWFLANDAADYILGLRPGLPAAVPVEVMGFTTLAVTLGLTALYWMLAERGWIGMEACLPWAETRGARSARSAAREQEA